MQLTIDRDPFNSGTLVVMRKMDLRAVAPDCPRHAVACEVFEELVTPFFETSLPDRDDDWRSCYDTIAAPVEHVDQIQDQLAAIEDVFGTQWAARFAELMLFPCPWNPGALSMAARNETLSPQESLEFVRAGYRAALIEAGGALPPAGQDDDWANIHRRQAIRMRVQEAELLEKMARRAEAARIYAELEKRVPRDNLGLHGRAGEIAQAT